LRINQYQVTGADFLDRIARALCKLNGDICPEAVINDDAAPEILIRQYLT
jgi:hypothetical protein